MTNTRGETYIEVEKEIESMGISLKEEAMEELEQRKNKHLSLKFK
jgi:hypothetical protein